MQAIGDAKCYVAAVRLGSDAASKGLRPGDQVVSVNGVKVLQQDIKYLTYSFRVFPQSGLHLEVQSPDGSKRALVAMAKVIPGQEIVRHSDVLEWMRHNHGPADRSRYYRPNKQVLFWELPDFLLSPEDAEHLVAKEHSYDTIVLDLRGNPGRAERRAGQVHRCVF
jgi:C-terminal processing protease CtpA/Prc